MFIVDISLVIISSGVPELLPAFLAGKELKMMNRTELQICYTEKKDWCTI
jgi:hypothetical protein